MSEMVPLPPEEKESGRPGWVLPLAIVSAVLIIALFGYLAWSWVGGVPEGSASLLSVLSRSPSSAATIALTPVIIGATAAPTEGASLPTATPSPTLKSPTATPTTLATETPLPTETLVVLEATDQPAEGEGTDEMPPTGLGTAYLIPVAMGLALLLVLARILRIRYQG